MDAFEQQQIEALIDAALEPKIEGIERKMMTHLAALAEQDRVYYGTRLKLTVDQASEAAEEARKAAQRALEAVAGQAYIVKRLDDQDKQSDETQGILRTLLSEVGRITGRSAGLAEAEEKLDKRMGTAGKVAAWLAGALSTGWAGKWIAAHWLRK